MSPEEADRIIKQLNHDNYVQGILWLERQLQKIRGGGR